MTLVLWILTAVALCLVASVLLDFRPVYHLWLLSRERKKEAHDSPGGF